MESLVVPARPADRELAEVEGSFPAWLFDGLQPAASPSAVDELLMLDYTASDADDLVLDLPPQLNLLSV